MSSECKETCFDYFDCTEYDCIRRDKPELDCWEIDDVKCKTHSEEFESLRNFLHSKLEACKHCIYYKQCNE